jgi:hypothetical protein
VETWRKLELPHRPQNVTPSANWAPHLVQATIFGLAATCSPSTPAADGKNAAESTDGELLPLLCPCIVGLLSR